MRVKYAGSNMTKIALDLAILSLYKTVRWADSLLKSFFMSEKKNWKRGN